MIYLIDRLRHPLRPWFAIFWFCGSIQKHASSSPSADLAKTEVHSRSHTPELQ